MTVETMRELLDARPAVLLHRADAADDDTHDTIQALGKRLCRLLLFGIMRVGHDAVAVDPSPVRLGHRQREFTRQEVISCIPVGNLDDITAPPEVLDRFPENDLH